MTATDRTGPPIPHGRTARRLEWPLLPPALRARIEQHCGSPVVTAESQNGGFTPGFASVLTCADGSRHFVKAASTRAQRAFADAYRAEASILAALPDSVPVPRLRWVLDEEWVVLGLEHVTGRCPARPWRGADLDACLDACEAVAAELTPAPDALALGSATDDLAGLVGGWDHVRATRPGLPHLDEAADLARAAPALVAGDTVVHTDLRDDNVLVDGAGRAWLCDWNWAVVGADWVDSLLLLVGPRGDGLDVEGVLGSRPLLREVPAGHVDAVLALLVGYFFRQRDEPMPATSPYLRRHQSWQGEVCWAWLAERRGWRVR